ncbi:calmodulin-binding protein [Sphingomonas sp. Leaf17]|uniref:DUF1338 domain-containing protein n=1 Tax=Sphingomonas sp. Leaf17 TaxID=1735683 RepID=UPI0006F830A4|nr:DUF1338 domain-containing protein [Sphingomonas sp. Leaf17]KQM67859.1 calmodulin-binding protein [Sphingomonas sp. Leaf17]
MTDVHQTQLRALLDACFGSARANHILRRIAADAAIGAGPQVAATVSRAVFAQAMNAALFADLLDRVPSARFYVEDVLASGAAVRFDHGALRTVRLPSGATGALPAGEQAFRRILEPLGYRVADVYPLPKLRMTGHAFRHLDHPETIPQFFVSELDVSAFDPAFGAAATRTFGTSRDPLTADHLALLARFETTGTAPFDDAVAGLSGIVAAFACQHDTPAAHDYDILRAASAEAAWIATEGNSFNHVTDRVEDVEALADRQRAMGRPVKDTVEVSASGRVRQTAYRADAVTRRFRHDDGTIEERVVPGSFYEFISRDIDPDTGLLDLRFDSANATGIFAMTTAA